MELFKNRKVAAGILALVIILFTILGINRSLWSLSSSIEDLFYDGIYNSDDRYNAPSISSQLDKRINAAMGLITVGNHYEALASQTEALRSARIELLDAKTLPAKYAANEKMENTYPELLHALASYSGLSSEDKAAVESYASTLSGAQAVIENSSYNEKVQEYYNETIRAFPLNILNPLVFVDGPDYFNMEG